MKDPLIISYDDLIESTKRQIKYLEANMKRFVHNGQVSEWHGTHWIETEKVKLKLLMKYKKNPQIDLFKAHQQMK